MAKRTKGATKSSGKATMRKAATRKAATRKAATRKTAKKAAKKVTSKKANAKKAPAKKVAKKAAKKVTARKATARNVAKSAAATLRIVSITPSADGAKWTVVTADGAKRRIPAGAAQSAGVKAGGRWTDALARKVERAEREQKLFTKAMGILAKSGSTTYEALVAKLGGDADARATVSALVEHGWIS